MMRPLLIGVRWIGILGFLTGIAVSASADDAATAGDAAIAAAISKSLPMLEAGAKGSLEHRKQCFNCHNQGLAIMALTTVRSRGFSIDDAHLKQQLQFTADFLTRNRQRYREGEGQGGQVDTAGYALWALHNGDWMPDETTSAVAEYLLLRQSDREHYAPEAIRPPGEQSPFTSTYVALRGLKVFGLPEQKSRIDSRIEIVRQWLNKSEPTDTEDRVFRLRALALLDPCDEKSQQASQELQSFQRSDGGWAQQAGMESDAYATGTALVALHESGGIATDNTVYQNGLKYLITIQKDDGSWHVVSHCKPFQTYYESGYPHGKDQFISMAAAGWSTTALALALPKSAHLIEPLQSPP